MSSFKPNEGPTAKGISPKPKLQYNRFVDPNEQAFYLEYPSGWKIEGALYRISQIDIRGNIRMYSPDGKITLFLGDKELPYFIIPNSMLEWGGFREGTWYSAGYGNNMLVQRYYPGLQFATQYASKISEGQAKFLKENNRPELARQLMGLQEVLYNGINIRMDAGDVYFQAPTGKGMQEGYVFANTLKTEMVNSTSNWHVEQLYGFMATPDKTGEAMDILRNVVHSFKMNPDWVRMQSNLTNQVVDIFTQTNTQISEMIKSTYENRSASLDRSNQRFSDAIRGVERFVDQYGTQHTAESGSNYYWINQFQEIIGTDIYKNPDAQHFRELLRFK